LEYLQKLTLHQKVAATRPVVKTEVGENCNNRDRRRREERGAPNGDGRGPSFSQ